MFIDDIYCAVPVSKLSLDLSAKSHHFIMYIRLPSYQISDTIVSSLNICTISDRSSKMAWICKQANRICPFLLWFRWLGGPLDGDTPGRSFMPRHLGRAKANGEKKTKICHLFAFPYMVTYCRATAIDKCPWLCPCLCRNQFSSANGSPHQVFGGIACLTLYRSN